MFRGTRVPIANVVASLNAGFDLVQLREAYQFLTPELIEAALRYERQPSAAITRTQGRFERRRLVSRQVIDLPGRRK